MPCLLDNVKMKYEIDILVSGLRVRKRQWTSQNPFDNGVLNLYNIFSPRNKVQKKPNYRALPPIRSRYIASKIYKLLSQQDYSLAKYIYLY